jgi:hypothetical protein
MGTLLGNMMIGQLVEVARDWLTAQNYPGPYVKRLKALLNH